MPPPFIMPDIGAIRSFLKRPQFSVERVPDAHGIGLHRYVIYRDSPEFGERLRGNGCDFNPDTAVMKAWGELVERYSFRESPPAGRGIQTSSGYAAHATIAKAKAAAVAELVERDALLNSWLLRRSARKIRPSRLLALHPFFRRLRRFAERESFEISLGVFGRCMGYTAGIAVVHRGERIAIATSAKSSRLALCGQLLKECGLLLNSWLTGERLDSIDELPEIPTPVDHRRYYLGKGKSTRLRYFVSERGEEAKIPDFAYEVVDLTAANPLASRTGFSVVRAVSSDCQNLWFGRTRIERLNRSRLESYNGCTVDIERVDLSPHPLP